MADLAVRERAIHRLDILGRQLGRVEAGDLYRIVTDGRSIDRDVLRRRAEAAAADAGLADLLKDARQRFVEWADEAFRRAGYDPSWIALNWGRSLGTAEDRAAAFRTIDDAVVATVAHELIPEPDRRELREPFDRMLALRPERRARADEH